MKNMTNLNCKDLNLLIDNIRQLVSIGDYCRCKEMIYQGMYDFPDAPEPHNLLGIVLEKEDNHLMAMRHFRAALALDESYLPALENLNRYGTFYNDGDDAYSYEDCQPVSKTPYEVQIDDKGVRTIVRRKLK